MGVRANFDSSTAAGFTEKIFKDVSGARLASMQKVGETQGSASSQGPRDVVLNRKAFLPFSSGSCQFAVSVHVCCIGHFIKENLLSRKTDDRKTGKTAIST